MCKVLDSVRKLSHSAALVHGGCYADLSTFDFLFIKDGFTLCNAVISYLEFILGVFGISVCCGETIYF